jgi:hypothetical protein
LSDFAELGLTNPLFKELDLACQKHNGLWNVEAEQILLKHFHVI